MEDNQPTYAGSGEEYTPGSQCAFSYRGPAWGQPLFSGADQRVRAGSAKSIGMAHCHKQFFLVGWVVFYWDLHPRVFWNFAASGAGRRGTDRRRDGLDAVEAARRRKARRTQNGAAARHIPARLLSLDDAADGGPGIHLRGDHARRERGAQPRAASLDDFGCAHWLRVDRAEHFPVLWICGPVSANPGAHGYVGDHAALVVSARLHRGTNRLEWYQGVGGVGDAAYWLTGCFS